MKKNLSLILCGVLLVACGGNKENTTQNNAIKIQKLQLIQKKIQSNQNGNGIYFKKIY